MNESPRSAARAQQLIGNAPSGHHVKRGIIELAFLTVVYVGCSASQPTV